MSSERVTDRSDNGYSERKRCTRVRFYVKRGQAPTTPTYLDVAKRDDDSEDWSAEQTLSLGIAGDYRSFVDWFPGGVYRRRQYRVRYSGGVDMAISGAVEYWEPIGG